MPGVRRRRLLPGFVLIASLALPSAAEPATQDPEIDRPSVLVVSLDDPEQPYVQAVQDGFRQAFDEAGSPAVVYREYFDQIRFGDRPSYAAEFRTWLHRKYRDRRLVVIVVTQQPILELFGQAPDNPWNDVPVVYGTLGHLTIDIQRTHPTASGLVMENFLPRSLDVIKTIRPETRRIAAIQGGSASERARDAWWLPQIRDSGLEVIDLRGLTVDELTAQVSNLPDDAVPYLFSLQTDASGRIFRLGQGHRMVATAANRPLFSLMGYQPASEIVGGATPDYQVAGRALGEHVLRRLDGAPPSVELLPTTAFLRMIFDGSQLVRWGIPESRLPPGSIVVNRPASLWRDYRGTVLAAIATVGVLTVLLAVALAERRNRSRAQMALQASYGQLRDLTDRLITAQEEERTRIARDLHDDIGQRVASFAIALSRAKRQAEHAPPAVAESLAELQQQSARLSTDLRQLSHDLHPGALEHLGLVQAIRARCLDFQEEHGVAVQFEVSDRWPEVPDAVALCLYRVAQEALRNVAIHAAATGVTVTLDRPADRLEMQVIDNGRGFDASRRSGLGLVSLGERVRMLGGRFEVATEPGAGTRITVTVPAEPARPLTS